MENNTSNIFEDLSVPKALAKFIVPSVISQLTMLILNLVDAFFVGRTGDTYQISAMTITFPIVMMIGCVATIFGAGANANIASCLADRNKEQAKRFSVFAIYTALGVVVLMIIVLLLFQKPLLGFLGADDNSLGFCQGYLFWVFLLGGLPIAFSQVMSQLLISEGKTTLASIGIAGAGIINAVLDPIMIFPLGMGVAGAGCATFVANLYSVVFFIVVYFKRKNESSLSLDIRLYTPKNGICKRTISIGIPAGLSSLLMNCCDFERNALIGSYGGQIELAAWGVVQKIGNAFMQICVGIAQGVRPLVAYNFTSGALKRSKSIINGSFLIMAVYTMFCILLVHAIPEILVDVFISVEEAVPVAVSFLRKWTFCIVGIGFLELFNAIFQAIGKWKVATADLIIGKSALMITMLELVRVLGVTGVVISQPITESIMAVAMLIVYFNIIKREEKKQGTY